MRQYNCSELKALAKLREKYVEIQDKHLALARKLEREEGELSDTHRKYIMAAQYKVSGSEFWSIYTSRYTTKAEIHQPECVLVDECLNIKLPMVQMPWSQSQSSRLMANLFRHQQLTVLA